MSRSISGRAQQLVEVERQLASTMPWIRSAPVLGGDRGTISAVSTR